jgi:hypothetical protein
MIAEAKAFLAAHARVLDRRRFERLFEDAPAEPVRDAVAAYRNPDGGFGHALEPDGRAPGSQPAAVAVALHTLHEADAWDEDLVRGACDWLESVEAPGGGVPFVLPSIEGWPAAPWWAPQEGLPPSLITTGQIAAPLLERGVRHPWLERAVEWLWSAEPEGDYDLLGALRFLDAAPDADRARAAIERLAARVPGVELVAPHVLSPWPGARSRAVVDPDLDALAAGMGDDGGWTFDWEAWNPLAKEEWRGSLTVDALVVLRANGRPLSDR